MKRLEINNRSLAVMALLVAAIWGAIFLQRAIVLGPDHEADPSNLSVPATPVQTIPAPAPPPISAAWQSPQLG